MSKRKELRAVPRLESVKNWKPTKRGADPVPVSLVLTVIVRPRWFCYLIDCYVFRPLRASMMVKSPIENFPDILQEVDYSLYVLIFHCSFSFSSIPPWWKSRFRPCSDPSPRMIAPPAPSCEAVRRFFIMAARTAPPGNLIPGFFGPDRHGCG